MPKTRNLIKKSSGYWHARIYVPTSCQSRVQRKELLRSLKTKSKAEAVQALDFLTPFIKDFFNMAKACPQLTADQLQDIARRYFDRLLVESKRVQLAREFKLGELDHYLTHLGEIEDRLKDWQDRNRLGQITEQVDEVMACEGICLPNGSEQHLDLSQKCLDALIAVNQSSIAHYTVQPNLEHYIQRQLSTSGNRVSATPAPNPICELAKRFCDQRAPAWRDRTTEKYRANLAVCAEIIGVTTPVSDVDKTTIRDLRDTLSRLPANWSKLWPDESSVRIAAREHSEDTRFLNPASVNAYLVALSSFFSWCVDEGYASANPVSGIRATERGRAEEKRDPFTIQQLQIIFDAPIYRGCRSSSKWNKTGNVIVRDTRYWMPIMGLYSGMRLGELLSLQRRDVLQEEGVSYFNIRRAKTDAGVRKVPVHPELIRCRFLPYIDNFTDNQPLFGDCSQKAYSKFFRRFQESIGLDDPKLVFHSFRHSFTDGLRSARIEESIAKVLLGHSDGSVTSRYGAGYAMRILNEAISSVEFKDLKIAHLYE